MSVRLTFYELKSSGVSGIEETIDALSSEKFTEETPSGFLVDRRSRTQLEARFIQKVVTNDSWSDPFGKTFKEERTVFHELRFMLRKQRPQLVFFNNSPAYRAFSGRLLAASNFRVAIAPLAWNPLEVIRRFENAFESLVVYAATPEPIQISPAVFVRLSFEGSEDVRKHVRSFTKTRAAKFSTLKFHFSAGGRTVKCEVKDSGSLAIFGEVDPVFLDKAFSLVQTALA